MSKSIIAQNAQKSQNHWVFSPPSVPTPKTIFQTADLSNNQQEKRYHEKELAIPVARNYFEARGGAAR
jgi:hypothetical protein